MSKFPDDAWSFGFSKRIAVGNVSTATTFPTTRDGVTAGCIMVSCPLETYIRLGTAAGLTCSTATDIRISPNWPHLIKTAGFGWIAGLNDATTSLAITAIEIG